YNFKQTCLEEVNNYEVIGYNSPVINYCTAEDVPHDIKFVVNKSGSLNIMFAPPKRECGFGVALLVNPLIKNERECKEYKFEDNIRLWFEYIFTGCYTLQFHIETSLPIDTGYLLEVMLISPQNKSQGRGCVWSGGPHIDRWKINLLVTSLKEALDNENCSVKSKEVTLYVNPQHDDFLNSACFESTDLSIVDNNDSEKEIDHDNLSCDDIVLLYTKNSMSFMALMKDFRETLAKMCSCSDASHELLLLKVYDWYEEAEWNDVAKVGPVSWFTKLLNGRCRAVWIDTPTTRSIVISRENDLDLNKLDKYYPIGDFRDMAFPVVLELAKRNINDAMHQYRRHFVVRFEGLESTANVKDPFMDLSPHARYRMPQHLAQLCLDLSRVELQCEVAGNPPPQVYWITGNEPERQIQELTTRAQEASNAVSTEWEGVSKIVSTYVIDCVRPEDQGLKYCVSVSKNIVDQSATVLLVN
ncbi:neural ectodermal development factor imp-l2, partial [Lasius niger]